MKCFLARIVVPLCVVVLCATANADSRIVEVWTCTVNEGHSLDEVKSENVNWLEFVNRTVDGGDIRTFVVSPIVGAQEQFMFVDSFPSMDAWTATKDAIATEEGLAVEAALAELASCASNSLYNSEEFPAE